MAEIKIKGQRLNNGGFQKFIDIDAPKSAELDTENNTLVFKNSTGDVVFSVDLSNLFK